MWVMRVAKGRSPRIRLGEKVKLKTATNSLGWEVQKLQPEKGWERVSPIVETPGMAELLKEEIAKSEPQAELRVYESVLFPLR